MSDKTLKYFDSTELPGHLSRLLKKDWNSKTLTFALTFFKWTSGNKNWENCGPPLGNKFDLGKGQRSPSRSRHGTTRKVLSQGTHMPIIKALSVIVQKLWPRLKFLWQTDRQTHRQRDEWDLMSPRFRESGGPRKRWTKITERLKFQELKTLTSFALTFYKWMPDGGYSQSQYNVAFLHYSAVALKTVQHLPLHFIIAQPHSKQHQGQTNQSGA